MHRVRSVERLAHIAAESKRLARRPTDQPADESASRPLDRYLPSANSSLFFHARPIKWHNSAMTKKHKTDNARQLASDEIQSGVLRHCPRRRILSRALSLVWGSRLSSPISPCPLSPVRLSIFLTFGKTFIKTGTVTRKRGAFGRGDGWSPFR